MHICLWLPLWDGEVDKVFLCRKCNVCMVWIGWDPIWWDKWDMLRDLKNEHDVNWMRYHLFVWFWCQEDRGQYSSGSQQTVSWKTQEFGIKVMETIKQFACAIVFSLTCTYLSLSLSLLWSISTRSIFFSFKEKIEQKPSRPITPGFHWLLHLNKISFFFFWEE